MKNKVLKKVYYSNFICVCLISSLSYCQVSLNHINQENEEEYDFINHQVKVECLINKVETQSNKTRLNNIDLCKIIISEFITFESTRDSFEKYLIQFNFFARKERFKTISFGPFQMQVEFIKKNTQNLDYRDIIMKIDSLSTVESQWNVLQQYVNNNPRLTLRQLINKYNSGNKKLEIPFKKINTKLTYYEVSNKLINLYYSAIPK